MLVKIKSLKTILAGVMVAGMALTTAAPAYASSHCDPKFITFPAWYSGLADGEDCAIKAPSEVEGGFKVFIWTIVLNIIEIMLHAVGYLAVGFIIYGGIKYMYSAGSPNGMMGARKTIMNAVIGLIISILSVAIVNTIAGSIK